MREMCPRDDFDGNNDEIITHITNPVDQTPNKKLIMDVGKYSSKNFIQNSSAQERS